MVVVHTCDPKVKREGGSQVKRCRRGGCEDGTVFGSFAVAPEVENIEVGGRKMVNETGRMVYDENGNCGQSRGLRALQSKCGFNAFLKSSSWDMCSISLKSNGK